MLNLPLHSSMHLDEQVVDQYATSETDREDLGNFSSSHLFRVFPSALRDATSSLNPLVPWSLGAQLVSLNLSSPSPQAHLVSALFERNAHSGYVLKGSQKKSFPDPSRAEMEGLKGGGGGERVHLRRKCKVLEGCLLPGVVSKESVCSVEVRREK